MTALLASRFATILSLGFPPISAAYSYRTDGSVDPEIGGYTIFEEALGQVVTE
jgi:hypothetical protein